MNHDVYQRAEAFLPWNLYKCIYNSAIFPYWGNCALYYFQGAPSGYHLLEVELESGQKNILFELKKIANAISACLQRVIDPDDLSLQWFSFDSQKNELFLAYDRLNWFFTLQGELIKKENQYVDSSFSPNKSWSLSAENHNLILKNLDQNTVEKITNDGQPYYDYASSPETNTRAVSDKLSEVKRYPIVRWSKNSNKFITHRVDQRKVEKLYLLQGAPEGKQRPVLHEYRMSFSGDEHLPKTELIIFDVVNKTTIPVKREATFSPYLTPIEYDWVWWSDNSSKVYFLEETRGSKKLSLCVADAETGIVTVLIEECADTYAEPCEFFLWKTHILVLEEKNGIIWMSMRDGHPHLYYYKIGKNEAEYAITQGSWNVRELISYDEKSDWLYFTAAGYHSDIDPYYKQLFRCHLDGSGLMCLTKEAADHAIALSPTNDYFIDTSSTIDTAPVITLKKIDGSMVGVLEKTNIEQLKEMNWVPPLRFHEKGRDGKTDIYGNLYFPSNFDKNKKYPLIDHVYPGPQVSRTVSNFTLYTAIFRSPWVAQALAELGFIVVQMDGFGTPGRSVEFHHATYGNMADCGLPDHAVVIRALSKKYPYIDLDRVGITGYSGGGYAAARGMLMYPELYKVGVAAAGNHDLRCYPASYGEKYNGLDVRSYEQESNVFLAEKLTGKLLLIHGEMDDNVHPCATMQFVDALIKHNKNFDMLLMPNMNHRTTFDHPYYWRKHWDYLVRNLLGINPPEHYVFGEIMPENFPQVYDF
ncbi:MAG TPA: DPP IV N-terminal domain-containing protein [Gammaproteobacteria bacterium]|nr:DPP IV N-terminal domain-containing protein [Gammaproteobacteria bacterium]